MSAAVHHRGEPNHSGASLDGTAGSRETDSDSREDKISSDLEDADITDTFHEVKLEEAVIEKEDDTHKVIQVKVENKTSLNDAPTIPSVNTVQLRRSTISVNSDDNRSSFRSSKRLSDVVSPPVITSPATSASKLELFKNWSVHKIVCTKQLLSEKLGRASVTVDSDVQLQVDVTRDTQLKLDQMYKEARSLTEAVAMMVQSQQALHTTFRELGQKMPELNGEFECNADTMKIIFKKGEVLVGDLNFFTSNIETLCGKTIEDTLLTIKQYEAARLEYDAHRTSLEADLKNPTKAEEAQKQFDIHREKFERLRADVLIKIRLMNENKLKVMRKQLFLLHCSVSSYFTELNSGMLDQQKRFKTIRSNTIDTNFLSDDI